MGRMTKAGGKEGHISNEAVSRIRKQLRTWYQLTSRELPWRDTSDPYRILVSEVMLQQTQVKTVIPYYQRFIERFPSVGDLAMADVQAVLKVWEGLGYYARARNLHRAAAVILSEHQGKIPQTYEEIRKLPGVGDYIAAAVLSIAFDQPLAVTDGNVKRVLARMLCMAYPVNRASDHKHFQAAAETLLDRSLPGMFNQAMMELGALICRPVAPDCGNCPVQSACLAFSAGTTGRYPEREKREPVPTYHVVAGIVFRKDKVLITKRKADGLLGGLWEFPGGKVQDAETSMAACIREIVEETNLSIESATYLCRVKHAYTHFKIIMDVFICQKPLGRVRLAGPVAYRWITLRELDQYPFPKANHKFFKQLRKSITEDHGG